MTSQYGACASPAGQARLHARTQMHTSTRPGIRMHARMQARALTRTDKYIILIAFTRQKLFANAPQCYIIRTLPHLLAFRKANSL